MAKSNVSKYQLSMAGEYGVCAELSKRGFDVSITMGNTKAVDIFVAKGTVLRKIEVKTTRSTKFVTGFFQKYYNPSQYHPDYWVLVQIDSNYNSRFFVLTHQEMGNIQMQRNGMVSWAHNPNGVDNVLLKDVKIYENQWNKI